MEVINKIDNFLNEVIKGQSSWTGKTEKGRKVKMSQEKSGMYYGEIRDEYGDISSSTTAKTKQDVDKWFSSQGIKKIKWDKMNETVYAGKFPMHPSKYEGHRPIQFMKWWGNYRPGDRVNVNFMDDGIELFGTNSEGQFAGSKYQKEMYIDDPTEMDYFKGSEGDIWNFV